MENKRSCTDEKVLLWMVDGNSFANRNTSAFISPEECETLEHWAGKSVLDALASIDIPKEVSAFVPPMLALCEHLC